MLKKDLAICIRAVDFSETSQVLTFFTRANGKIGAIAKGSKRPKSPFDGPVEMLSYGEIVFTDGKDKLATLTEFQQSPIVSNLQKNLYAMYCCLFAAELINHLIHDYDPHPELFDSFLQFMQNLNEQQTSDEHRDSLALLILFQLSLLRAVGLQPILSHCANCKTSHESRRVGLAPPSDYTHPKQRVAGILPANRGRDALDTEAATRSNYEVYFSSTANGLICRDCEPSFPDKIKLSTAAAACLTDLKQLADANQKTLTEIEKVLINHFTQNLGHCLKMPKHILGK
jgi:DNA repair protein RecO